jgi:hypothetical protein
MVCCSQLKSAATDGRFWTDMMGRRSRCGTLVDAASMDASINLKSAATDGRF